MQPLERDKLRGILSNAEIERLEELLVRRFSLCDDEPAELAQALDQEIDTLIGNRKARIWEALQ